MMTECLDPATELRGQRNLNFVIEPTSNARLLPPAAGLAYVLASLKLQTESFLRLAMICCLEVPLYGDIVAQLCRCRDSALEQLSLCPLILIARSDWL